MDRPKRPINHKKRRYEPRAAVWNDLQGCWELPLTKGFSCLLDEVDKEFAEQWCWAANGGKRPYAVRGSRSHWGNRGSKIVLLHREIALRAGLLLVDGLDVDHKNRNKLDNRRCNLRLATRAQNMVNKAPRVDNTTGCSGVQLMPSGKYRVMLGSAHIGVAENLEDAVRLRMEAAECVYGEFSPYDD